MYSSQQHGKSNSALTVPYTSLVEEIYRIFFSDKIELTRVHHDFEADAFFPEINPAIGK
jgi:hypothetical protein